VTPLSFLDASPESKELKQRVRDVVDPGLSLGHSDDGDPDDDEPDGGTGRTAFQRLLSVVLGDRRADPKDRRITDGSP
jgi:hypothetical protein